MTINRINHIVNTKKIYDVFYNEKPVWIQEFNKNQAIIGFMDNCKEQSVSIDELYEKNI